MNTLPWLRKDGAAAAVKAKWAAGPGLGVPLPVGEGGSMPAVNAGLWADKQSAMLNGGRPRGIGCLTWLANDLSYVGLKLQPERLEACARSLWSATADGNAHMGSMGDPLTWWENNPARFPTAWPEKFTLPILVRDASKAPAAGKYRLLALDEAPPDPPCQSQFSESSVVRGQGVALLISQWGPSIFVCWGGRRVMDHDLHLTWPWHIDAYLRIWFCLSPPVSFSLGLGYRASCCTQNFHLPASVFSLISVRSALFSQLF